MTFALHERLAADTLHITDLPLCRVLLMNNARFPWVILVPRQLDTREITDLSPADRHRLMDEVSSVSEQLQQLTGAYKMNVAALGNMVPQLHIHIIARLEGDAAWPNPVWGTGGEAYTAQVAAEWAETLQNALATK